MPLPFLPDEEGQPLPITFNEEGKIMKMNPETGEFVPAIVRGGMIVAGAPGALPSAGSGADKGGKGAKGKNHGDEKGKGKGNAKKNDHNTNKKDDAADKKKKKKEGACGCCG